MSTPLITRADFQALADVRAAEAKALLDLGLWDGAYYLAGYAVELGLKACIIKALMATDGFPKKDFTRDCYTHDLKLLARRRASGPPSRRPRPPTRTCWRTGRW